MRGVSVRRAVVCGVAIVLLAGCEREPEPPRVWETAGLSSPLPDVPEARPGMCAVGLTCATPIRNEPKVACRMTIKDDEGVLYDSYAGVEKRGRSSLAFDKPNYGIELRDEDANNNPIDVMGMGKEEDWILDGSWIDRSFVRNQLVSDLFASFSSERYAAEGRYCTLHMNGDYAGIYRFVERPKRDGNRIDIAGDPGTGESFVIRQGMGGPLDLRLGLEADWELTYPNNDTVTDEQLLGIQDWLDALADALKEHSADPDDGVFSLLDEADVVDWVIVQELSRNVDAYKLSVHLYKDVDGRARMVPWDFDLAFGQPIVAPNAPEPEGAEESTGWVLQRTQFIEDLFAVPGFAERIADRWAALRANELANETIFGLIDGYVEVLEPELSDNFDRWPLERVRFEHIYPPYSLYDVDSHEAEIERLRDWIAQRLEWIDANIDKLVD